MSKLASPKTMAIRTSARSVILRRRALGSAFGRNLSMRIHSNCVRQGGLILANYQSLTAKSKICVRSLQSQSPWPSNKEGMQYLARQKNLLHACRKSFAAHWNCKELYRGDMYVSLQDHHWFSVSLCRRESTGLRFAKIAWLGR